MRRILADVTGGPDLLLPSGDAMAVGGSGVG